MKAPLPKPGDRLPDIALTAADGGSIHLGDFAGRKAVLFFYPKDDTPGCTTEAREFSGLLPDFAAAGIAVLGISKDPPEKHQRFAAKHGLAVPLATDAAEGGLSDALGIWTEKSLYGKRFMGMVRTTILLGEDGTVLRVWPRVKPAGHAAEVLAAARGE